VLALPEAWVWDFWLVDDGRRHHLFFLYASRALHDPDARHHRAAVGHAVSDDLHAWTRVPDALVHSDPPAFDDLATWTGSVVRDDDGTWWMFYTGATLTPAGNVQSVGYATSTDLVTWHKEPGPVLRADPRWYEKLDDRQWHDEAFRDPWVMRDPSGSGWHMLITARANSGPADERGVVGHATSTDLRTWALQPPLSRPGQGFGAMEVMQYEYLEGQGVLIFSASVHDVSLARRAGGTTGGVWVARAASPLGPYDLAGAVQITDDSRYVGRLVQERTTGRWLLLAFVNNGTDGSFVGGITDPEPFHLPWSVQDRPLAPTCAPLPLRQPDPSS
jgi:sucrose-6-phosphate hydrolase SacC (GH32 family)